MLSDKISGEFLIRLGKAVNLLGNYKDLAAALDISTASASNCLAGRSDLRRHHVTKLLDATGVSAEWLLRGEGQMMRRDIDLDPVDPALLETIRATVFEKMVHMGLALPSAAMAKLLGEIDAIVKTVVREHSDNPARLGMEVAALIDKAAEVWPAAQDTPEHKEEEARILRNLFYED